MESELRKSPRYPVELTKRVGLWLQKSPRGGQKLASEMLAVTPRTLRSWKLQQKNNKVIKRGRPRAAITLSEMIAVAREWRRQCYPGVRPVLQALPFVRVRAARKVIGLLKARREKRKAAIKKEFRQKVQVIQARTVVTMDGASLSKGDDYIVYRDRGSLSVNAQKCGGHLNSEDTMRTLEDLKEKGRLPLVLGTDNGSPFCCEKVKTFLDDNHVVHLKNLPHVPQHNGSCENAVREFKELLQNNLSADSGVEQLNQNRKRRSLGWRTSKMYDNENFASINIQQRQIFYNSVKQNLKEALIGITSAFVKRKTEREVILKTMENFSIIKVTRGTPSARSKAEEIT